MKKPVHDRLFGHTARIPEAGCWIFLGKVGNRGYGLIWLDGKRLQAHRLAWALANGRPIPAGLLVRHKCDTPLCVNPDHLCLGTDADNMLDKAMRGRTGSKLTPADVLEIRKDARTTDQVARAFGVSATTVRGIRNHLRWRFVA